MLSCPLFERARLLAAALAAVLLAPGLEAQTGQKSNGTHRAVAKVPKEARKALAAAGKLARVPRGTPELERAERLEKARGAFEDVERKFASTPIVVAEAAFRQGQLLGRLARREDAVAAFERAATKSPQGFGARALLEAGHVERREKSFPAAAAAYRRAIGYAGGRYSDRARLWLGKTLVRLGRVSDARKEWQDLGGDAKADTYVRIQAFDELAMSWVREKKAGEARRTIASAESVLASEVAGESKKAKSLRGTLGRMRSRKSVAKLEARLSKDKQK